jgi:hypothetical protein
MRGLALVLHAKFNAVGWLYMDAQLMPLVRARQAQQQQQQQLQLLQHHYWQQQQQQP